MFRGFRICMKKLGGESPEVDPYFKVKKFNFRSLAEDYAATIFEISLSH